MPGVPGGPQGWLSDPYFPDWRPERCSPPTLPERIFDGNESTFKRHFRRWRKTLTEHSVEWLPDGLRHTAASMHYAQYRDITRTAGLLGDQIRIVQEHYTGLAIQSEAKAFYALLPPDSNGDVLAIDNDLTAAEKTL